MQGPCVLFATPGMLHGGVSLAVFKAWAPDSNNLVLLPSYQVAGTLGRKLLAGQTKDVDIDAHTRLDVNCKVPYTVCMLRCYLSSKERFHVKPSSWQQQQQAPDNSFQCPR